MTYEENLDHQLRMLDVTWSKFLENGLTDDKEITLEFLYVAPNKKAAKNLNEALEYYDSFVRSEGFIKKRWLVSGQSYPTTVTKDILAQWLDYMIALGWDHECEFDGFGASI